MIQACKDIRTLATLVAAVSSISAILFWNAAFSDETVSVSATVGLSGIPPVVMGTNPSLPIITVSRNGSQTVSLRVYDSDNA
jgi:ABC-type sugar transport system permease subunit